MKSKTVKLTFLKQGRFNVTSIVQTQISNGICKCCHRNKEVWGIKLNYNSIARTGLYGSAILVHQYSCFFNKSILKVFGVCTVSAFVVSYKGKERNFIPVSSRSSAGALIGDTIN